MGDLDEMVHSILVTINPKWIEREAENVASKDDAQDMLIRNLTDELEQVRRENSEMKNKWHFLLNVKRRNVFKLKWISCVETLSGCSSRCQPILLQQGRRRMRLSRIQISCVRIIYPLNKGGCTLVSKCFNLLPMRHG